MRRPASFVNYPALRRGNRTIVVFGLLCRFLAESTMTRSKQATSKKQEARSKAGQLRGISYRESLIPEGLLQVHVCRVDFGDDVDARYDVGQER